MNRGVVVGEVWASRKCPSLEGKKLSLVVLANVAAPADEVVVAIDVLDARVGDEVLLTYGSGARNVLQPGPDNREMLVDAAICERIDGRSEEA
ncbi:MAG: EutN/CcmL family microcompartment protein [Deltaproteobacteria bacterium]|nr:EutN/CcmL family microcompartment protein [Deltaproteobacteria bacterium]